MFDSLSLLLQIMPPYERVPPRKGSILEHETIVTDSAIMITMCGIATSAVKNLWYARRVDRDLRNVSETRAAEMSLRVARKFADQWSSKSNRVWRLSQVALMGAVSAVSVAVVCEDIAEMFVPEKKK